MQIATGQVILIHTRPCMDHALLHPTQPVLHNSKTKFFKKKSPSLVTLDGSALVGHSVRQFKSCIALS